MNDTTKIWIPLDNNLSREEKSILALQVSKTQEMNWLNFRSLVGSKLVRLMDQEDDPLELLAAVPDLYLAAQYAENNRDRVAAIMDESSLRDLVSRVDLEANDPPPPWTQELIEEYPEQSLSSLMGALATSLR